MELNPLKVPVSSLAAPAAVVIFCAFLALAAARFPGGFSPLTVSMGEMGDPGLNMDGAGIFNAGCMIAGVPVLVFFAGLYKWYGEELWRNLFLGGAQVAGVAAGISLIMSGYYPEIYADEHFFWLTAFFASLLVAVLLANAGLLTLWKYSNRVGIVGMVSIALLAVAATAMLATGEVAVFEWASLALAFAWMIAMAADMYVTFQ